MRAHTTTTCEVVGGPRDGDLIEVPGVEPPATLRVVVAPDASALYVWHPAVQGMPDMLDAELVVLDRRHRPRVGRPTWQYVWPQG